MAVPSLEQELPQIGKMLGKYRLASILGRGGMGCVFEAVHSQLEHRVAIKVLKPESSSDRDDIARFEREGRVAARLKTRHAVKIFDVDTTSRDLPYIVMELIEG